MRIIGGEYRRRRLLAPAGAETTRPIPDRVKEALFNLLRGNVEGAAVLDAFAGTGSIGLEAISRGAALCIFVEHDRGAANLLGRNIESLGCADRCRVIHGDALGAALVSRCPDRLDLAFFDPPYAMVEREPSWRRLRLQLQRVTGRLSDGGFLILRMPWPVRRGGSNARQGADLAVPGAEGPETRPYGSMAVHLYMRRREKEGREERPAQVESVDA